MKKRKLNEEEKVNVNTRIEKYKSIKQEHFDNNQPVSAKHIQNTINALNDWL